MAAPFRKRHGRSGIRYLMIINEKEYIAPQLEVTMFRTSTSVATSSTDPEEGDEGVDPPPGGRPAGGGFNDDDFLGDVAEDEVYDSDVEVVPDEVDMPDNSPEEQTE